MSKTTPQRTFYWILNNKNLISHCPGFATHKRILAYPISQSWFLSGNFLFITHRLKKKTTLQEVDFFQAFLEIWPFSQVMTENFSCLPQIHLRCLLSPVSMGSLGQEFASSCHTSSCPSFRPLTHKCSIAESQRYQTCCHTYWTGATNTAVLPPTQDVSTAFPLYPSHLKSDAVIFFRYIFLPYKDRMFTCICSSRYARGHPELSHLIDYIPKWTSGGELKEREAMGVLTSSQDRTVGPHSTPPLMQGGRLDFLLSRAGPEPTGLSSSADLIPLTPGDLHYLRLLTLALCSALRVTPEPFVAGEL